MRAKVVQLCSEVDNETNVNKEEEIDLECAWQDPIGPLGKQNLIQQGNWYSLPNPIWFQLHSMLDARARLFDYIGRRTLGFPGKNTKLSPVAMPWPGNDEIAQLIGVSRGDNVSTLKKQLQRSGMIVVWKDPETKKEWVGINPTLFHIPPIVCRFLGQHCGKYDYRTIRWIVNVRKSYDDKSFKVLRFALYFFKECILEIQSLDFKNLKCSKDGQLFLHKEPNKLHHSLDSLNNKLKRYYIEKKDRNSVKTSKEESLELFTPRSSQDQPNAAFGDDRDYPKLSHSKQSPSPPSTTPTLPPAIKQMLDYWNNSGLARTVNPNTKTFKQTVSALKGLRKGVFFDDKGEGFERWKGRQFTVEEFTMAVQRFSLATNDAKYLPIDKKHYKKTSLLHFLYHPFVTNAPKSLFIEFLTNEPRLTEMAIAQLDDPDPRVTNVLVSWYRNKILGGIKWEPSTAVRNKFVRATQRLLKFFEDNKGRIVVYMGDPKLKVAQ